MSDDKALMQEALALDGSGQTALLASDPEGARDDLRAAADKYRESWEAAGDGPGGRPRVGTAQGAEPTGPTAFGRLVGMLKASILAGEGATAAMYVHHAVGDDPQSPTSAYAVAIAALVAGDDARAGGFAERMRAGGDAFARTADAIVALAAGDEAAYAAALQAIVDDFAARDEHLTGVAIADTALMLERLAEPRGLDSGVRSPLLPR